MIAVTVTTLTSLKRAQGQGLIFEAVIISGCGLRRSSGGRNKTSDPALPCPAPATSLLYCLAQRILVLKKSSRIYFIFLPNSCFTGWEFFHYLLNVILSDQQTETREVNFTTNIGLSKHSRNVSQPIIVHQQTFYFALLSHSRDSKNSSSSADTFINLTNIKGAWDCT